MEERPESVLSPEIVTSAEFVEKVIDDGANVSPSVRFAAVSLPITQESPLVGTVPGSQFTPSLRLPLAPPTQTYPGLP